MNDFLEEHQTGWMMLRITVVLGFFIATVSVLQAFLSLVTYFYFMMYGNGMEVAGDPEWNRVMQELEASKVSFLLLNLYNIVVWNGVIILTIWLFRLQDWARRVLGWVLGLDMIVTVGHLIWLVVQEQLSIDAPGFFILLNTIQVGVILLLVHPDVVKLTEIQAQGQKNQP